jgi:hypothetical protein
MAFSQASIAFVTSTTGRSRAAGHAGKVPRCDQGMWWAVQCLQDTAKMLQTGHCYGHTFGWKGGTAIAWSIHWVHLWSMMQRRDRKYCTVLYLYCVWS